MTPGWPYESERRYQALITEQLRKGCVGLCLLGISLFPAFALLDYVAHREQLEALLTIRFVTVAVLVLIFLFIWKIPPRRPYWVGVLLLSLASASITAMCLVLDGYESPYYAGVNLVVLAAVVVMPAGPGRIGAAAALVIAIYLLGILADSGFVIDQPAALVNNLYFLLATAIIGTAAAYLTDHLRRESFARYLEIEKAQADLKQSRDMLQMELQSEQGNVELLVREITERKAELEKALELAQTARDEANRALQLREEFISLASHELNTPLTSLRLQTQLAQRRLDPQQGLPAEAVAKLISSYDSQLKRLIRMVGDMFDISRIKSGRLEIERAPLDLAELVQGVVERATESASEASPRIALRIDGPVHGEWDAFRVEQVVLNLLTNAMKYGAGKPIEIHVGRQDGAAFVRVRDQGIGISPESQTRIFERFERAVGSRQYTGLGLGLYIARQIVTAHGGEIRVESQPGAGSTFIVELPAA